MKKSHILILFLIAISIGVVAMQLSNVSSYSDFSDAKQKEGKELQLKGTLVKDKPVVFNPQTDANSFSFYLIDQKGKEGKVICYDDKPKDFEKSDDIVLTGSMKQDVFYATDILVKCPSKYVDTQVEKAEY